MKTLTLIICLTLVSGFAFSQWIEQKTSDVLSAVYFPDTNTGYAVGGHVSLKKPIGFQIIIKTINGGTTWITLSSGEGIPLRSVFFTDINIGYAVGGGGIILKTIDGGTNWINLSSGTGITLNSVFFANNDTGYAVGGSIDWPQSEIILKTTNGGTTWDTLASAPSVPLKSVFFTDVNTGYAVGGNTSDGGGIILKTFDGGLNWISLSFGSLNFNSVYFTNINTGYAVGGNSIEGGGIILKTIDGGTTWIELSHGTDFHLNSVYFIDANTGYVVGEMGTILKTIDGGKKWWDSILSETGIPLNSVFFTNADTGYAAGGGGTILKTTNGGGFPTAAENTSLESTFAVYPNPAKDFIVFDLPNSSEFATVEIYDIQGKKVVQQKLTETKQIAVGHLPKGLYFVSVNRWYKVLFQQIGCRVAESLTHQKMKKLTLIICITVVFCSCNLLVFSQNVENRKFNSDQPIIFTPKNHDPNFLKSGKLSEQSFYQRKSDWQHIIDSTWGPGAPLAEKLLIYNTYAKTIHDQFDGFYTQKLNWDSLYNHYLIQITESTSRGAFSAIMSHFAFALNDRHTAAWDSKVVYTPLNPRVPILLFGNFNTFEHFGAVTTILSDSTTLVLRVPSNYPLKLEPGDIILGYEGVPWKNLVSELLDAGLPVLGIKGGCKSAATFHSLLGAGLNWHLFSTIDILKHSTGDTLHLSVAPLLELNIPPMSNNDQLPIKNIPFPQVLPYPHISDTVVTFGILENTNTGYIFLAKEYPTGTADMQFYNAINTLKNTDALIIDMRLNRGGWALFEKAFNVLFNEYHKTIEDAYRCNTNTFELCPATQWGNYKINGLGADYYDRPIAVLLGPSCGSMGDLTAQRLRYHPMVKFFGASSSAVLGENLYIETFPDWFMWYSISDMFHISEPGVYLNRKEFPIDYPVWFNKDDVAKGIDPIVEKSLSWINNLAYGHDVTIENGLFSPTGDSVIINAVVENPNSHDLSTKLILESLDGSIVDSTDMAIPNLTEVSKWSGKWKTPDSIENTYWVSVKVKDLTDGSSFNNKHATRITTAGPVVLDSIWFKKQSTYYQIKPFIKNESAVTIIKVPTLTITCTDPWALPINQNKRSLPQILPGGTVNAGSPFQLKCIDSLFTGYFNFKVEISSNGYVYWTDSVKLIVDTLLVDSLSDGIELLSLPVAINLEQNYPNPFNSVTTITWQIAKNSKVTLKVLDIVGRTVATLVDEQRPQGKYETQFNAVTLPKGIYFCQLKAGEFMQTRKMILME